MKKKDGVVLKDFNTEDAGKGLTPIVLLALGIAILLALTVKVCGVHPLTALKYFFQASIGSKMAWGETLACMVVLTLSGLAMAVTFRVGLFNIGAEGQFLLGAVGAAFIGLNVLPESTPWPLGIPILLMAGMVSGACWSMIAGALKNWQGVSEVISTLMLNLVAIWILKFLVNTPGWLQDPQSNEGKSALFPNGVCLQEWGGTSFHAGVFVLIPIVILIHILVFHTRAGLSIRATGLNPVAAKACGIPVGRVSFLVFALTGALAGLGGAMAVMAMGYLPANLYTDYGYMAIAVALVARLQPLAILPSAFFFAALETGALGMEQQTNVPSQLVYVVQGVVILAMLMRGMRMPGTGRSIDAATAAS